MSADMLRRAAAEMRKCAEAATPGPWTHGPWAHEVSGARLVASTHNAHAGNAAHIASWHPAVAFAVADWLDDEALWQERPGGPVRLSAHNPALAFARAYLGEQP